MHSSFLSTAAFLLGASAALAPIVQANIHVDVGPHLANNLVKRGPPKAYSNTSSNNKLARKKRSTGSCPAGQHKKKKSKASSSSADAQGAAATTTQPVALAAAQKDVKTTTSPATAAAATTSSSSSSYNTASLAAAASYQIADDYSGKNFFDNFDFFNYADPTHGQVNYVDSTTAWAKGLVSITSKNTAIMRVDNTSWLASGANRNSVRVTSKKTFSKGSLVIFDAARMPYGKSVWPAFWSVGDNWPYGGEIDIVEQINDSPTNQMTLHSGPGCTLSQPMSASGTVLVTECNGLVNGNTGCGVMDNKQDTYGSKFNSVGGGVFAMQWTDSGIKIWSFLRADIPDDINAGYPNPSSWGTPAAAWSSSTCSMDHFAAQTIVINLTLCGDWASYDFQNLFGESCSAAVQNPTNYDNALFEINYVKVYTAK
ncbi:hypothetical protein T439DRAFT_322449 [Meredithblackwellia eburnea MCA 4105]